MKVLSNFFKVFFLAIGVVWFLCGLSIVIFKLNFGMKEIILTLIFPLAYAIVRQFDLNTNEDEESPSSA